MKISINSSYEDTLKALNLDGNQLQFASETFKDNLELCQAAVNQNFASIRFCSDRLKGDKDIALLAISKTGLSENDGVNASVIYNNIISQSLRDDLDFILNAYLLNSIYIRPPEYLLGDLFFMHQVVSKNGMLIRYASIELRQNRQLVLIAAKQDGRFLCENNFQMYWDDREIALAASISSSEYLPCISNHFISDPEFLDGIISNAINIKKVFLIPENLLYSNNGVLNLKNLTSCLLNLNSGDKLLLLIRLIEYDFLTKEVIEMLEIELLNNNQKTDTIKLFLQYAKRKGVHKFQ
jgi:hypothetical protein